MKNQYFGDKRDCFKYDLLIELVEKLNLDQLTFIPMLTPSDQSNDGQLVDYAGNGRRQDLVDFLGRQVKTGHRNVVQLREYFKGRDFRFIPYRDNEEDKGSLFQHDSRDEYIDGIPGHALSKGLVFFDPDNGFEVESMRPGNSDKYLKFSELKRVLDRTGKQSIAIVFQYLPRIRRQDYLDEMKSRFRREFTQWRVVAVADREIAFFIFAPNPSTHARLESILLTYTNRIHQATGGLSVTSL